MADTDLPQNPFDEDPPEFVLEGPHGQEIIGYLGEYIAAKQDYLALIQQESFRHLHIAIDALTEEEARRVLLCAMAYAVWIRLGERDQFVEWVEKQ